MRRENTNLGIIVKDISEHVGDTFWRRVVLRLIALAEETYLLMDLLRASLRTGLRRPVPYSIISEQLYTMIYTSLPLTLTTSFCVGAVMALQFGFGLERFGGKLLIPAVVAISLVRELGPVFTGLMLAARVGSGTAAELGGMQVTQQVDALRALGSDPLKKLVFPRIVALSFGTPLLSLLSILSGVIGAMLISSLQLDIPMALYLQKTYDAIKLTAIFAGCIKAFVFGLFISLLSCHQGLKTTEGTVGIGRSTTRAVVVCSIFIMLSDFVLTKLLWLFKW